LGNLFAQREAVLPALVERLAVEFYNWQRHWPVA
jgi:hypothetical protein